MKVRRIVYYISDNGWGHLTRSLRVIEELLDRGFKITVVNRFKDAFHYLKERFRDLLTIESTEFQGDPIFPREYPFKEEDVEKEVIKVINLKDKWIESETSRLKKLKPCLIISDITPWAFNVAEKLGIPSIAITNINWWDEYSFILQERDLRELQEFFIAYSKATLALILPFESENRPFRNIVRIPIIARKIDWDRVKDLRKTLLTTYRPSLIGAVTLGGHYLKSNRLVEMIKSIMSEISKKCRNILWIGESRFRIESTNFLEVNDFTNFHEVVASSDFIIGKVGYGLLSEMVMADISGLLFYRKRVLEDVINAETMEEAKWAITIAFEDRIEKVDLAKLFNLEKLPKSKRLLADGTREVIDWVERYV
ncbi:MAG: glycosyltransferase family protein [Thermosulfidibacteraceae bacterium]|jgi:UDP-N-acetylglucosamine:LPS N-acetylglucosamine transferase